MKCRGCKGKGCYFCRGTGKAMTVKEWMSKNKRYTEMQILIQKIFSPNDVDLRDPRWCILWVNDEKVVQGDPYFTDVDAYISGYLQALETSGVEVSVSFENLMDYDPKESYSTTSFLKIAR